MEGATRGHGQGRVRKTSELVLFFLSWVLVKEPDSQKVGIRRVESGGEGV